MKKAFGSAPNWVKVTLWATFAILAFAIIVPAALRTTAAGFRGEHDPAVIEQREHARKVEITEAKAEDKIKDLEGKIAKLESSLARSNKILSGTGSKTVPTSALLRELPPCALEDGSTQKVCVWDGRKQGNKVGAIVVNIDKGKISFFPQTNGWVVNK